MNKPKTFPHTRSKGNATVKIYRLKRGKYEEYRVRYYINGQRKFDTRSEWEEADKRADEIMDSMNRGEIELLTLSGEDKIVYSRAVGALEPLGVALDVAASRYADAIRAMNGTGSLLEAAKEYARRHKSLAGSKTVAEVVDEFVAVKTAAKRSKRYLEDLDYRLGKFKGSFHGSISAVTGDQIAAFLGGLKTVKGVKLGPRSYNNFRNTISTLFVYAKKKGYVVKDWAELDSVEISGDDHGEEITTFTVEELINLLQHATPDVLPILILGAFAGCRAAEAAELEWQDLNFETGYINIAKKKAKTRSNRIVPILEPLKQWLFPIAKKTGEIWPHGRTYFYKKLAVVAEAAGVKWKDNALRHSFISYRVADTNDVNKTALESGNSPGKIFSNYRALMTPEAAQRWFSIKPDGDGKILFLDAHKKAATVGRAAA